MNILEAYNRLTVDEKKLLQIGFESGTPQIVILQDGVFLAVNFDNREGYVPTETKNRWTVGVTNHRKVL